MLSIELIRRDPDQVRRALAARGEEDPLEQLLEIDSRRRAVLTEGDELRAQRNRATMRRSRLSPG